MCVVCPSDCCTPVARLLARCEEEAIELERLLRSLADRHRLRILNMLVQAGAPVCVCEFTAAFELPQQNVSYHLKQLVDAGVIARERRGRYSYYAARRRSALDHIADPESLLPEQASRMNRELLRALTAEAIGTFALVFAGCGAIMVDAKTHQLGHVGVAITFGLVIMFGIYAVGHISGAHFNAAVTFAFALTRHFPWSRALAYWARSSSVRCAAAALLRASLGNIAHVGATLPSGSQGQAFLWELVMSAFLMFVILAVATDTRAVGRGGGDRDRRHDRPRRDVRRADHRRLDEPDALARRRRSSPATCTRSGSTSLAPIARRLARRARLPVRPRRADAARASCTDARSPEEAA